MGESQIVFFTRAMKLAIKRCPHLVSPQLHNWDSFDTSSDKKVVSLYPILFNVKQCGEVFL